MLKGTVISSMLSILLLAACEPEDTDALGGPGRRRGPNGEVLDENGNPVGEDPSNPANNDPTQPGVCKEGVPHVGFAQTNFVANREPGALGVDRRRVKPFAVLRSDFQRALGTVPAGMNAATAAYGDVPARWYAEPTAGAVSLITTYSLAFTGCYDTMTTGPFAAAPTMQTATEECGKMQRKFWQRTPAQDETEACAKLAVNDITSTEPRRKWAHACASVMTAAGFTTY
jgi:hypothetical protein